MIFSRQRIARTLVLFNSFLLLSCQSALDVAGNTHQSVEAKWRALSAYAESKLLKYGVTVKADLIVERQKNQAMFNLRNIGFSLKATRRELDLLNPSFEQKYICLPECYQLLEYTDLDGQSSGTMLSNFYLKYEFELFQFYGDLVLLSAQLEELKEYNAVLLNPYLTSLTQSKYSFESIKSFTVFLMEVLTLESYQRYIDNPDVLLTDFLEGYFISPDKAWNVAENAKLSFTGNSENSIINNDDQIFKSDVSQFSNPVEINGPEKMWVPDEKNSPDTMWNNEEVLDNKGWLDNDELSIVYLTWLEQSEKSAEMSIFSNLPKADESFWLEARKLPIVLATMVCSFQENFFGKVISIGDDEVEVALIGKGKTLKQGILGNLPSGSLFSATTAISFIPLNDNVYLNKNDIAPCMIDQ